MQGLLRAASRALRLGGAVSLAAAPAVGRADPPWYAGLEVAQVGLEAVDGALPDENLEPLLRVRQGEPLDLGDVRQDVALLYRAGTFAAVEAHVEPWFGGDAGERSAVRVVYRVRPPDRLRRVRLRGVRGAALRVARKGLGAHRDDVIFDIQDLRAFDDRTTTALAEAGWPDAQVDVTLQRRPDRRADLSVQVEKGPARRSGELAILGDVVGHGQCAGGVPCALRPGQVRRWMRRSGVQRGQRVAPGDFEAAVQELRARLVSRGWLSARVGYVSAPAAPGEREARTLRIEAGPRLRIRVDRRRTWRSRLLPNRGQRQDVLGFFGGERLEADTLLEADRRLTEWYHQLGFAEAEVELRLEPADEGHRLWMAVDPGPRHRVRRLIPVDGAVAISPAFAAGALRDADPEVLGEGRYSEEGLARALDGLRSVYRGQGYLDAQPQVSAKELTRPLVLPSVFPRRRGVWVELRIQVDEGPQTLLRGLQTTGGDGLEADLLAELDPPLVGGPYSRARLDAVARQIALAYQEQGHLQADATVEVQVDAAAHAADALLRIDPGPVVRLRSVVLRGNRRTRGRVITRELELRVGDPITPTGLAEARADLHALNLFRVVSPELVGDDDRSRDLLITLEEKPNVLLEAGGRVSTDQGVLATGRVAHRNLGGLGHGVSALGQVGYAWSADSFRVDTATPVWQLALRYTAPYVPGKGHSLVVEGLLQEQAQEPVFRLRRSGALVGVRSRWGKRLNSFVDYRVQWRTLEGIDPGALVCGDPWLATLGATGCDVPAGALPSAPRPQGGPEALLLFDGRNDPFNPTRGSSWSAQVQVSDGLLGGGVFVKGDLRAETFIGLGPVVLDLFGRGGLGWTLDGGSTLPIEDRYMLGGGGSMRGFRLNSVGPANFSGRPELGLPTELEPVVEGIGVRGAPARWVPTGGDVVVQGTAELRVPWSALGLKDWTSTSFVFFSDVGRLGFLDPTVQTTSRRLGLDLPVRYSLGLGLRQGTPIGPAAIEIGFNPSPQAEREEPGFQMHLSLGEL